MFGWSIDDRPMGPGRVLHDVSTGIQKHRRGLYDPSLTNLPWACLPHWNLYIATANADETVDRASSGRRATLLAPAFDVMEFGRLAVIQDIRPEPGILPLAGQETPGY